MIRAACSLTIFLYLLLLFTLPASAVRPPAKKNDAKRPAAAASEAPPVIDIRRRSQEPQELARERERRERARRAFPAWCAAFREAERPLRRALAEADRSLKAAWGPWSRNVCYALRLELDAFVERYVPPCPDPALQAVLDHALKLLGEAATACTQGLPTVTQLRLQPALRELARVDAAVAACGPRAVW